MSEQKQDIQQQALANALAKRLQQDDDLLNSKIVNRLQQARQNALRHDQQTEAGIGKTLAISLVQHPYIVALIFAVLLGLSYVVLQTFSNSVSDAYLLSEELPPEAFINEDFGAWLSKDNY